MKPRPVGLLLASSLLLAGTVRAPADDAKVLVNHVGYDVAGPKRAVIQGRAGDAFASFKLVDAATGAAALTGAVAAVGPVRNWKDWVYATADFSALAREGTFFIECAAADGAVIRSEPFPVRKNILERETLSAVVAYFKGQRSSGLLDKADRALRFEGLPGTADLRGGWFDATGDYGKHLSHLSFSTYFNPQQVSLTAWSLFRTWRELDRRADPNFRQYLRRLLDEALFGADYLVRSKNPEGSFIITVSGRGPEKKPEDRLISPKAERHIILTPETKDKVRDYGRERIAGRAAYEAGYREGAGLCVAALAMAAAAGAADDYGPADYLRAAEDAFSHLEAHNVLYLNDGKENIVDDYCALLAAVELFRTTEKAVYREAADRRAERLAARLASNGPWKDSWRADDGDRPFFHPADAGLPALSLLEYAGIADAAGRDRALDAVRRSLRFELGVTGEVANPFGYARQLVRSQDGRVRTAFFFPHDTETAPWWQGENARLGSLAAAARSAARAFARDAAFRDELRRYAADQLNWILGLNPYDSCMLYGRGRNNPEYLFFDSYEYTNAPGGISNGITAGYRDEDDIDYALHFAQTGKDDDWRWTEQWLPHAAWYLLAVALGGD